MDNSNGFNYNHKGEGTNFENQRQIGKLLLYNDDTNTFDHVIDNLSVFCDMGLEQAEQLALIAHYNGKITIKEGPLESLQKIHDDLINVGLIVELIS